MVVRALTSQASTRRVEHTSGKVDIGFARDPDISATGRFVAWMGHHPGATAGTFDIYLTDRISGQTELLSRAPDGSPANGGSEAPSISADGRYVAFASHASNLVPDDTNGARDIFVYDREQKSLQRASLDSQGQQLEGYCSQPVLSGDGQHVAFTSAGLGLVLRDLESGQLEQLAGTQASSPDLSNDAGVVVWSEDEQVVRLDRTSQTRQVEPGWAPQLSADGQTLAYLGRQGLQVASVNHTRAVSLDWQGRPLDRVGGFTLSGDGSTVAYQAEEGRMVLERRLDSDEVRLVTADRRGGFDYGESTHPVLSHDGSTITLATSCRNLGPTTVRVDQGYEPYRIFTIDTSNLHLAMEQAIAEGETAAPLPSLVIHDDEVEIGGFSLPRG
ncbi:MAG: hypothetical protein AB7S38_19055 [Vulcanimicrobiota bacterium]